MVTKLKENQTVIITALISMIVTGGAFWLLLGKEVMTRGEIVEVVKTTSPYAVDRKQIFSILDRQTRIIERLEAQSRYTEGAISGITAQLDAIQSRLAGVEGRVFK